MQFSAALKIRDSHLCLRVVLVLEVEVELRYGVIGGTQLADSGERLAVSGDHLQLGDDTGKENVFLFINLVVN